MMDMRLVWIVFAAFTAPATCDNCQTTKAYKVFTMGSNELRFYSDLRNNAMQMNVAIERPARRMNSSFIFTVPDCYDQQIASMMKQYQIQNFEVFNPQFQHQQLRQRFNDFSRPVDPEIVTRRYLSQDEANIYIDDMAQRIREANPRVLVDIFVEGYSTENRPIRSISIQHLDRPDNPFIFIDSGIHAREWHSRSMALYFLKKLADEAALDQEGLLYKASFVIVPTVNPDGYEFSRNGNHLWRKNRRKITNDCIGVDGNRNYDAHWSDGNEERYPCREVYRGSKPFSEPETKIIRDIMARLKGRCKMYISIHTYGNTIIYPYGYTKNKHSSHAQLHQVAQAGVDAVRAETGTVYVANQSGTGLYVAAGGSDDYAIDGGGIPYAFTFELGAEELGFAVPVDQLRKTVEEGFIALRAMVLKVVFL